MLPAGRGPPVRRKMSAPSAWARDTAILMTATSCPTVPIQCAQGQGFGCPLRERELRRPCCLRPVLSRLAPAPLTHADV